MHAQLSLVCVCVNSSLILTTAVRSTNTRRNMRVFRLLSSAVDILVLLGCVVASREEFFVHVSTAQNGATVYFSKSGVPSNQCHSISSVIEGQPICDCCLKQVFILEVCNWSVTVCASCWGLSLVWGVSLATIRSMSYFHPQLNGFYCSDAFYYF